MTARPKTLLEIQRLKTAIDELVIAWLALGLTVAEIAYNLKRTNKVVEWRWRNIKAKYGFQSYQDATRYALENGLIPLEVRDEQILQNALVRLHDRRRGLGPPTGIDRDEDFDR